MEAKSQRQKGRNDAPPSLNAAISAVDSARDDTNLKLAKDLFASTSVLLTIIKVSFLPILAGQSLFHARRIHLPTKLTAWSWG